MRVQKWLVGASIIGLMLGGTTAYAYDAEFDYNGDGSVDSEDLELINDAFNTGEGDPGYDPIFDHDGNGTVGGTDIMLTQDAVRADS